MKMDDSNWFPRWEEELPSPEELISLSQTLITPDLAIAFDIGNTVSPNHPPPPPPQLLDDQGNYAVSAQPNLSAEFESSEVGGGGGGVDDQARTLKRPRLVWTPQLHKRFVDAVAHLGIKNAVPKTIMQLMSVDGLTRENVASHLQKYRLYLKRMQGMSNVGSNSPGVDSTSDHLFASSPVPPHFLRPNSEQYVSYVPVATMQHQGPQIAVHQQFRHFGNSPPTGQFDHPFLGTQQVHRIGTPSSYVANAESPTPNGRKVLTLFPAGED